MSDDKRKKITVQVASDVFDLMDEQRHRQKIEFQAVGAATFEAWARGHIRVRTNANPAVSVGPVKPDTYPYCTENRGVHERLEAILKSGDLDTIKAITQNIEVFFDRLRPSARRASGKS